MTGTTLLRDRLFLFGNCNIIPDRYDDVSPQTPLLITI